MNLQFDGVEIPARRCESIAAALTRAGIFEFRNGRGVFCGMGVCQDCVVDLDGRAVRACMTEVAGPHRIRSRSAPDAPPATLPPIEIEKIPVVTPEVLVIGGGAGGLSAAAAAAEAGAAVVLLDERARPGGQYYKQPARDGRPAHDDRQFADGRALIARARQAGVQIIGKAEVWGAFTPLDLAVLDETGFSIYRPRRLIVATGAYERGLPVPGWTLPGVMTTGAAQTLLRSYDVVPGRRVLIAGNGPLNMQVAVELARRGVEVVAVAELAPRLGPRGAAALWGMAITSPGSLRDGIAMLAELQRRRVPVLFGHALLGVDVREGGLVARLGSGSFEVDAVCMGYGFLPSNELLRALGCRHGFDARRGHLITERDADCATTVPGIYAVGDCCGLGGARAAAAEGVIAGVAAAGRAPPPGLVRERDMARRDLARHRRFQDALWRLFAAPRPQPMPDAIVCRCQSVTFRDIEAALLEGLPSIGELKRRTRVGMGSCQGRYCAPLLAELLAQRQFRKLDEMALFAPRAPVKPVTISEISRPGKS